MREEPPPDGPDYPPSGLSDMLEGYDPKAPRRERLREFEHAGRTCTVFKNARIPGIWSHHTGYVETTLAPHVHFEELNDHVRVHHGLTYSDGDKVGFDTGHAFDVNVDEDGEPLEGDLNTRMGHPRPSDIMPYRTWSPDDVEEEVRDLAEQIDRVEREMGAK